MGNYKIMHRNEIVATTEGFEVKSISLPELCPVMIKKGASIVPWMNLRSIDTSRGNAQRLYQALGLSANASIDNKILTGHAVTIEDNWWIQRSDEDCSYDKLKAYDKTVADIAISGSSDQSTGITGYTELGTLGSYEKAWRKIDGIWFLHKKDDKAELLSEFFSYNLLSELCVDVAEYSVARWLSPTGIEKELIVSKDFTEGGRYDFEPFICYFGDNEDYNYIIGELKKLEKDVPGLVDAYIRMTFYDALINNTDRHNGNIGFLRDSGSGRIKCLAPAFDYNQALIARDENLIFKPKKMGYIGYFIGNMPLEEMRGKLLARETLEDAIKKAEEKTLRKFPDNAKAVSQCGKYVMDAYEGINKVYEKKLYPAITVS